MPEVLDFNNVTMVTSDNFFTKKCSRRDEDKYICFKVLFFFKQTIFEN